MDESAWSRPLKLAELSHGPVSRRLCAGADLRERIAAQLGLDGLEALKAQVAASPWLDGARVEGRLHADVRQTCGVTLEPVSSAIDHTFELRLLPAGSPNAPAEPEDAVVDPGAEDPPDLLEGEEIDLGALVVEQLALEIDPFPRKPGAVFDAGAREEPPSPFAVLKDFKPRGG